MKKLPVTILVFLAAGIFCLLTDPLSATEDTSGKFAVLADISGNVEISHDGTASWQAIHQGDFLAEGDWIQTESGSKATIGFDPNLLNTVTLQESSRARVDQLRNTTTLQLPAGTVTSLMNGLQPGEEFQVQTPTAVIGVRGTGFIIQVAPDGNTTVVQVKDGSVEVQQTNVDQQPTGQKAEATPQQNVTVTPTGIDTSRQQDPTLNRIWEEYTKDLQKLKKPTPRQERGKNIEHERRILKEKIKLLKEKVKKTNTTEPSKHPESKGKPVETADPDVE